MKLILAIIATYAYVSILVPLGYNDHQKENYYHLINKANRLYYQNNLHDALDAYEEAFSTSHYHFFVDFKKAIIISKKINSTSKTTNLLLKLKKEQVIDTEYFKYEFPKYQKYFNESEMKIINSFRDKNKEIKNKLCDLFKVDQRIRSIPSFVKNNSVWYVKDSDTIDNKTFYNYRDSMDELNAVLFLNMIASIGFPSEKKTGYFQYFLDKKVPVASTQENIISTLCLHFLSTKYQKEVVKQLNKSLIDGDIHPSTYASCMDYVWQNQTVKDSSLNYMNTTVNIVNDKYYTPFVYYTDSLMALVNMNRTRIGLDSFQISQKQIICNLICLDSCSNNCVSIYNYVKLNNHNLGFIKAAFEKEKANLNDYEIKLDKIKTECPCNILTY